MTKIKQKRYNLVSKYFGVVMNLFKALLLLFPLSLFANDIGMVFDFLNEAMHNLDDTLAQLFLLAFLVLIFVLFGIGYLIYFFFFRNPKVVDERLYQKVDEEEAKQLKKISNFFLYVGGLYAVVLLLNFVFVLPFVHNGLVFLPIVLFGLLYRYLYDESHLLLGALIFSVIDFGVYMLLILEALPLMEIFALRDIIQIDILTVLQYLPLLLVLRFYTKNALAPKYALMYKLQIVLLVMAIALTTLDGAYRYIFFVYDLSFLLFCTTAFFETKHRIEC